jgi:hypothetical protein
MLMIDPYKIVFGICYGKYRANSCNRADDASLLYGLVCHLRPCKYLRYTAGVIVIIIYEECSNMNASRTLKLKISSTQQ